MTTEYTRDLSAIDAAVAAYTALNNSGDPATTAQDLMADLMHYASRERFHVSYDRAWTNYAAESGRCKFCGQTEQEILEDADDEDDDNISPCGGYEERTGDTGPHDFEWDDIEDARRATEGL